MGSVVKKRRKRMAKKKHKKLLKKTRIQRRNKKQFLEFYKNQLFRNRDHRVADLIDCDYGAIFNIVKDGAIV